MEYSESYEVLEDNGGGLSLFIFKDGRLIYSHYGYEHSVGSLKADIKNLEYENPESWENNEADGLETYNYLKNSQYGVNIAARGYKKNKKWSHELYKNDMGAAGLEEFNINT